MRWEIVPQRTASDFENAVPSIWFQINNRNSWDSVFVSTPLGIRGFPVTFLSAPDGGYDTSRLWRGRHNSVIPLPKLAHTKGLPPSPWESVSKFHFTRCGVYAQVACPGSIARWRSIGSAELSASHVMASYCPPPRRCVYLYHPIFSFQDSEKGL